MLKKFCLSLFVFLLLIAAWEVATIRLPNLRFVLPAPSKILLALVQWRSRFFFHSMATAKEMLGGFLLATLCAFPLAWSMLRFKVTRTLLQPIFIIIQCLPMFALAPIMVIWFGWGYTAIVLPTMLMIFFPLTLNIYQGFKATPGELLDFFKVNEATHLQTLFKLHLPWALPHIFAGFRISAAIAGIGAVAGEWAGAQKGLGILMLESRRNIDLEITFGALLCLTCMSTLLYGTILLLETLIVRYRYLKLPKLTLAFLKRRKKGLVLPLFLCLFCIFGCNSKESNRVDLLLDWLPNQNHIPLYVGIEQGFFQEMGIDLKIQKMHDNGGVISYLTSKQTDLAIYHLPGTLRAAGYGADLKIVGYLIKKPLRCLIYHADPAVVHPCDLSGKRLGYCIGGPDTSFLDFLLDQGKISDYDKRNVSVDLISAMGTKQVDFIYGGFWNIEPHLLSSFGVTTDYFKIEELNVPPYPEMIILANANSRFGQAPFTGAFQKALQRSIDFCKQEPEQAFASYARANPDKRKKTLRWETVGWQETLPILAEDQVADLEMIQSFHDWQVEQKIVSRRIEPSSLL